MTRDRALKGMIELSLQTESLDATLLQSDIPTWFDDRAQPTIEEVQVEAPVVSAAAQPSFSFGSFGASGNSSGPRKHGAIDHVSLPHELGESPFPALIVEQPIGESLPPGANTRDLVIRERRAASSHLFRALSAHLIANSARLKPDALRFVSLPYAGDADAYGAMFDALAHCRSLVILDFASNTQSQEGYALNKMLDAAGMRDREEPFAVTVSSLSTFWQKFAAMLQSCTLVKLIDTPPFVAADEADDARMFDDRYVDEFVTAAYKHAHLAQLGALSLHVPGTEDKSLFVWHLRTAAAASEPEPRFAFKLQRGRDRGEWPAAVIARLVVCEWRSSRRKPTRVESDCVPPHVSLLRAMKLCCDDDPSWLSQVHTIAWSVRHSPVLSQTTVGDVFVRDLGALVVTYGAPALLSLTIDVPEMTGDISSALLSLLHVVERSQSLRTLHFHAPDTFWPDGGVVQRMADVLTAPACPLRLFSASYVDKVVLERWIQSASKVDASGKVHARWTDCPVEPAAPPDGVSMYGSPTERMLLYELVRRRTHPELSAIDIRVVARSDSTSLMEAAEAVALCSAIGSNPNLRSVKLPLLPRDIPMLLSALASSGVTELHLPAVVATKSPLPPRDIELLFGALPAHVRHVSMKVTLAECLDDELFAAFDGDGAPLPPHDVVVALVHGLQRRPMHKLHLESGVVCLQQITSLATGTIARVLSVDAALQGVRDCPGTFSSSGRPSLPATVPELQAWRGELSALMRRCAVQWRAEAPNREDSNISKLHHAHALLDLFIACFGRCRLVEESWSLKNSHASLELSAMLMLQFAELFRCASLPRVLQLDSFQTYGFDSSLEPVCVAVDALQSSLRADGPSCTLEVERCAAVLLPVFFGTRVRLLPGTVDEPSGYKSARKDAADLKQWRAAHLDSVLGAANEYQLTVDADAASAEETLTRLSAARVRGWRGVLRVDVKNWQLATEAFLQRLLALHVTSVNFSHAYESDLQPHKRRKYSRGSEDDEDDDDMQARPPATTTATAFDVAAHTKAAYIVLAQHLELESFGSTREYVETIMTAVRSANATVLQRFARHYGVKLVRDELPPATHRTTHLARAETRADAAFRLLTGDWCVQPSAVAQQTSVQCALCSRAVRVAVDLCATLTARAGGCLQQALPAGTTPDAIVLWTLDDTLDTSCEHMVGAHAVVACLACAPYAHQVSDANA
jgi:hypothetical protein